MRTVTVKEMKDIDRAAIEEYGIPALILMENAGVAVANCAEAMMPSDCSLALLCGRGNNGGDGFVAARHLINREKETSLFLVGRREEVKGEARINLNILLEMNQPISELRSKKDLVDLKKTLETKTLIIDAIFGIGLQGQVKTPADEIIRILNDSQKPIIAVDVPSGLDADTGEVLGNCVMATKTVTMGLAKKGFFLNEGPRYVGEIVVADIGIPEKLLHSITLSN